MKVILFCSLDDCDQPVDRDPLDGVKNIDAVEAETRYCPNHERMIKEKRDKIVVILAVVAKAISHLNTLKNTLDEASKSDTPDPLDLPENQCPLELIRATVAAFEIDY
jgi:hypothetical protein